MTIRFAFMGPGRVVYRRSGPVLAGLGHRSNKGSETEALASTRSNDKAQEQIQQRLASTRPGAGGLLQRRSYQTNKVDNRDEFRPEMGAFSGSRPPNMPSQFDVSRCPASESDGTRTRNHRIDSSVVALVTSLFISMSYDD